MSHELNRASRRHRGGRSRLGRRRRRLGRRKAGALGRQSRPHQSLPFLARQGQPRRQGAAGGAPQRQVVPRRRPEGRPVRGRLRQAHRGEALPGHRQRHQRLLTSLARLDIGPGDEVILPPYTFMATVNVVLLTTPCRSSSIPTWRRSKSTPARSKRPSPIEPP